jgi:hypothetical protein
LSPLAEREARAEGVTETDKNGHRILGTKVELTDGKTSPEVHILVRQQNLLPVVEVEGPANLTVRFYPALNKNRFEGGNEVSMPIQYTIAEVGGEAPITNSYPGVFTESEFKSPNLSGSGLVVGTPAEFTVKVRKGTFRFSVTQPNGFLEVVNVEHVEEKPQPPAPEPPAEPKQMPKIPVATEPPVEQKPEKPAEEPKKEQRPVVQFSGEHARVHELGSHENTGDLNSMLLVGDIKAGEKFSVLLAGAFTSNSLELEMPDAVTKLRSFSGDGGLGVRYMNGSHSMHVLALAGYRSVSTDVRSLADDRTYDDKDGSFGYGAQAGYSFDRWFAATVSGSNDPFNPFSGRIFGALPYGWVSNAYPNAELDLRWLHSLKPVEQENVVGVVDLADNAFHGRLALGLPLFRAGPVVPSALVAGEMNTSKDGVHGDVLLGGALGLDFLEDRLKIEAAGAASPLTAAPMFLLRLNYSQ